MLDLLQALSLCSQHKKPAEGDSGYRTGGIDIKRYWLARKICERKEGDAYQQCRTPIEHC